MIEIFTVSAYFCLSLAFICIAHQLALAIIGIINPSQLNKTISINSKARFIIFVPAHNESVGLIPTLASLKSMNYPMDLYSVVVIADNCTDDTATVASFAGVDVWIRQDRDRHGKGHALTWAFARLNQHCYEAAVVIDADTKTGPDLLAQFNSAMQSSKSFAHASAYQARYEFAGEECENAWLQPLSMAAKSAENSFVYRPREFLGLVNILQGNGFCLPVSVLIKVPWKASSIVEDAEYAIELCLAGIDCHYLDDTCVISRIAKSGGESTPQKIRWFKGMILLMHKQIPRLLWHAFCQRRAKLAEAAFMLLTTSRLTSIYLLTGGVFFMLFSSTRNYIYLEVLLTIILFFQIVYAVLVISASSSGPMTLKNVWLLPRYVLHIAVAHVKSIVTLRSRVWTRTVR